jgi:signal peptidase II
VKQAWIFAAVLILDQGTKWVVKHTMALGQSIRVFGDAVRLTFVENPGMAFGLRIGKGTVFTVFSLFACAFLVFYLWKNRHAGTGFSSSLFLILGGAVGNLIDRIAFGRVVDFIDVGFRHLRWPVFNVADSSVVIGMGILMVFMIREDRHRTRNQLTASG